MTKEREDNSAISEYPTILGIDPGSRNVGFALLLSRRKIPLVPADFRIVDAGLLKADPKLDHSLRICRLHEALN